MLIAAEVERLAGQSFEYTTGMALVNRQGRGVAPATALKTLVEKAGDPGTAVFTGMLLVDPGEYRLIVSLADSEGRVGSVSRAVTAWAMEPNTLTLGDLLLGGFSAEEKTALSPAIEPAIAAGQMAALMEVYGPPALLTFGAPNTLEATLEILVSEDAKPLAAAAMRIAAGSSPEIATMSSQFSTTALPPGRYLARATIRQGGKTHGHLIRPFRIVPARTAAIGDAIVPASGVLPNEMIVLLLGGLSSFDRKELLSPSTLTPIFAAVESRPTGSKAAIKEARAGDLGAAAMTALGEGDQVLATFLKGLEFYQKEQLDRAAMQFQNSMQMAPTFAPSRLFLGATLAEANRHREAAGLLQSAATAPPNGAIARLAGEEWIKAGQPQLAITSLELAMQQPGAEPRTRKLLGIAYALGGRPVDAVATLTPYLDASPADPSALLAVMFGTIFATCRRRSPLRSPPIARIWRSGSKHTHRRKDRCSRWWPRGSSTCRTQDKRVSGPIIHVADVSRRFGPYTALNGVTLTLPRGGVYGLVGANGAGKTTLIKHILGLLRAETGEVRVFGLDPVADPVGVLSRIGYLSENHDLPSWMSVDELMRYSRASTPPGIQDMRRGFAVRSASTRRRESRTCRRDKRPEPVCSWRCRIARSCCCSMTVIWPRPRRPPRHP